MAFSIKKLTEWLVGHGAKVIDPPKDPIKNHLEMDVDLLVHHSAKGTLGLVKKLDKKALGEEPLEDAIRKTVRQGSYLRSLLMDAANYSTEPGTLRYQHLAIHFVASKGKEKDISKALSDLARDTEHFHHVGVHMLLHSRSKLLASDFERAFPWLLVRTERWFKDYQTKDHLLPEKVSMKNYRLAGERVIEVKDQHQIHLFHGHNGTGKSSLVEAFEFLLAGKSQRLENCSKDCREIICHHGTKLEHLSLSLQTQEGEIQFSFEDRNCLLEDDLSTHAFMLNQNLMHELILRDDKKRQELFLEYWFPTEGAILNRKVKAAESTAILWDLVSPNLRDKILAVLKRKDLGAHDQNLGTLFPWLNDSNKPSTHDTWFHQLEDQHLQALGLDPFQGKTLSEMRGFFQDVEQTIAPYRKEKTKLEKAEKVLGRYASWFYQPNVNPSSAPFPELVNDWLRAHAQAALLEESLKLRKTIRDANLSKEEVKDWVNTSQRIDELEKTANAARQEATLQRATVDQYGQQTQAEANESHVAPTAADRLLLDEMVPGVANLGTDLYNAMMQLDTDAGGKFPKGWAETHLATIRNILEALSLDHRAADNLRALEDYHREQQKLQEAVKDLGTTFLKRLQDEGLSGPLDELMSLFTPARWAYQPFELHIHDDGLELGNDANLKLNTAELNTFVLALFLLMGPRHSRLLILDDPLQNMDELTVATLARGFARLLTVLPKDLKLLFLFHGEDDLGRFRMEVPAAIYRLPWVEHADSKNPDKVIITGDPGIQEKYACFTQLIPELTP